MTSKKRTELSRTPGSKRKSGQGAPARRTAGRARINKAKAATALVKAITSKARPAKADAASAPGAGTKLATLIDLLSSKSGASIEEMSDATGWQAHSVRGAIAGTLRKKGHVVASDKRDGVRRYRLQGPA